MKSAKQVDQYIHQLIQSEMPDQDKAWQLALACEGWPYIFGDRGQYCTSGHRQAVYNKHPDQEGLIKKCQILNGSESGCGGCKWYPGGERVRSFDCRGFTYWVLLQIYGWKLIGTGATKQWEDESNWKAKGTIDTIPEDVLVCLFYTDKKNPKIMAHTGFGYKGETVECSNGVQHFTSRNKKWTHWAVPYCIGEEVPQPDPDKLPTLRKGDKGKYVTLAQTKLIQKGYDLGKWGADGKFGDATEKAVKAFQTDCGLTADGVIGQKTWDALEGEPVTTLYTVKIPMLTKYQAEGLIDKYPGSVMIEEGR